MTGDIQRKALWHIFCRLRGGVCRNNGGSEVEAGDVVEGNELNRGQKTEYLQMREGDGQEEGALKMQG